MTDNVVEIRITSKDLSDAGFKSGEQRAKSFGAQLVATLSRAGERAGESMSRSIGEKMRDGSEGASRTASAAGVAVGEAFVRGASTAFQQFTTMIGGVASSAASSLVGIGGTTAATGGLNLLVGALLAVVAAAAAAAAALVALAPAAFLIGGAFGAATTLVVGLGASLAVLGLGLGGIGDAWTAFGQKASGGGGSAAAAAKMATQAQRELRSATQGLADAQRAAVQAQMAVTAARAAETERLEDLSRSVRGARLDEEGAVLAVSRAEQRLREVRRSGGSRQDIKEAELAYRQAVLAVEEVRDRVGDLTAEQEEGARKGVEGSDQVQAALERQDQAQRGLVQATERLADAQKALKEGAAGAGGAVDRFAEAMAKLSPNAQALVRTLIDLKPRFDALKMSVQDRLLAGFDTTVRNLAEKWLPALGPMLGALADKLNGVGKTFAEAFGKSTFIENIRTALAGFGGFVERVGKAIGGPLVDAFGRLASASAPFLGMLGEKIAGLVENFSKWIKTADESGDLSKFMTDAANTLSRIWDIGGLAFKILGDIIEILFPTSKRASGSALDGIQGGLQMLHNWLSDETNKTAMQDWLTKITDFVSLVTKDWIPKAAEWIGKIGTWISTAGEWINAIWSIPGEFLAAWADMFATIESDIDSVVKSVRGLPDRIRKASVGMFDGIRDAFRAAMNSIIDGWNRLHFRLPGFNAFGMNFGGINLETPDIPHMAQGGIGGGLTVVGERGRELVNLPQGSTVIPNGTTEAMLAGGGTGGKVHITIDLLGADAELKRRIQKMTRVDGGGNVQVAFGYRSR